MNPVEKAIAYAAEVFSGQTCPDGHTPAILRAAETAAIAASMTHSPEVIAAAVLRGADPEDVRRELGDAVAGLVAQEALEPADDASWYTRREKSLKQLMNSDRDGKLLCLADKLCEMRSLYRLYRAEGDAMWRRFSEQDKNVQGWYYHTVADLLTELQNTAAYEEYLRLMNAVFGAEHDR